MRVICGKYKGRRFFPPKKFPSRPTTDFAKEGLFNVLENHLHWQQTAALDAFSGTGSISLELLSRGVKSLQSVDHHPVVIRHLHRLHQELKDPRWKVIKSDAQKFVQHGADRYDFIFADPPFETYPIHQWIESVFACKRLCQGGRLVVEHKAKSDLSSHPQWQMTRRYGNIDFSFFAEGA